ncbi:hypothetical protein Y1Q_0018522 [Alligator mississippiensis]|uniref:Uncharacterized protein n=1 Tax=Alligator mississippiensis TaxID=8496 RepID=A0A151P230_ALLMI|nr:hypothetical protein Y1Q_0018522 [Alligator mississippiensis]
MGGRVAHSLGNLTLRHGIYIVKSIVQQLHGHYEISCSPNRTLLPYITLVLPGKESPAGVDIGVTSSSPGLSQFLQESSLPHWRWVGATPRVTGIREVVVRGTNPNNAAAGKTVPA